MAEPLKTFFSPARVRALAEDIAKAEPSFPAKAFIKRATTGLDELELLARGKHISKALAEHLPDDYETAIDVLLRSLGPEYQSDELVGAGMAPFAYLPHVLFVADRGLDHFDLSMRAQYELTKRFSAEGSIRPYIAKDPERTFKYLQKWAGDPNAHVRRLVSEGTRLRLPWAMGVKWLDENPERVLALLELLKDDPTTLVRRSVANNLNDMGKVHPDLLARTAAGWLKDATPERRALVEHALRSAVKRKDPDALRILGFGAKPAVAIESVRFEPRRVRIGGKVEVSFKVRSTAVAKRVAHARSTAGGMPQDLLVDLAVHFVKANGRTSPKVFKLKRVSLAPGEEVTLSTRVSLAIHTTRKPNVGVHPVDVLVNGVEFPIGSFEVTAA
jgi:3-methyladenine DNA glycosylase AlkC